MSVPPAMFTMRLPNFWRAILPFEKCSTRWTWRSAMTISASPRRIGWTRSPMRSCGYWLSPSVFTTMSAPSSRARWTPSWNDRPRPRLRAWCTNSVTPCSRATSTVRSVEPSSMMSTMISSIPGISFGIVLSTRGRVSCSFRQGTWTTSFTCRATSLTGPVHGTWCGEPDGNGHVGRTGQLSRRGRRRERLPFRRSPNPARARSAKGTH